MPRQLFLLRTTRLAIESNDWLRRGRAIVVAYTAFGWDEIVSITQRYQILIIFVGMALAFIIAVHRLPPIIVRSRSKRRRWHGENYRRSISRWTRIGATRLGRESLADFFSHSPISAPTSLRFNGISRRVINRPADRSLFNAVVKVPMQFLILLLGAMVSCSTSRRAAYYFIAHAYEEQSHSGMVPS